MDELNLLAAGGPLLLSDLDNPNKMTFSGILTYLGVPSDQPPGGSGGRKVMIPVDVGRESLESLIGTPVNLSASLDSHDTDAVIGVIDEAWLGDETERGTPIHVKGHIFAKSFPNEAMTIKASQDTLGFSYETAKTRLEAGLFRGEPVAIARKLVFTGAAILYKMAAAYQSTSLAASAESGEDKGDDSVEDVKDTSVENVEVAVDAPVEEEKVVEAQADEVVEEKQEEAPVVEESQVEAAKSDDDSAIDKKDVELDSQLVQLIPELIAEIKACREELKAFKENDVKAAAEVVESEPQRRSLDSTQLMAKYDKKDEDLLASIENKGYTRPEDSMAAKLAAFFPSSNK